MQTIKLTDSQTNALNFARSYKGVVYCGKNIDDKSKQIRVNASTLRSLERLGFGVCDQEIGTGYLMFRMFGATA